MGETTTPDKGAKAFTMMEMLVVMLIIAILVVIGTVRYLRSSETGKATQAVSELNMLSTANRNYSLDHNRLYAAGVIDNSCNGAACTGGGASCDIVACGYVTNRDWSNLPFTFAALAPQQSGGGCSTPSISTYCPSLASGPSGCYVACGQRKICGGAITTNCVAATSQYAQWGFLVDTSGVVVPVNGAPSPG